MEKRRIHLEKELSPEEMEKREKEREVRQNADRIARQILTLSRNGLFVSLRFMDVALCQFQYLSTDQIAEGPIKVKTIATTGEHLIFEPQYIIEQYMKDKQGLARDYLHIVLHCVFRHPFVSQNLNEKYWDLACDIAVEGIITELEVKQTYTKNAAAIATEIARIRSMVKQVTAEYMYQYLTSGKASEKDIARWRKLFCRDDHKVWWEIAKQIADEMKRREDEEKQDSADTDENDAPLPDEEPEDEGEDTDDAEKEGEEPGDEESGDAADGEDSDEETGDETDDARGEDSGEGDEDETGEGNEESEGSEESEEGEETEESADEEADEAGEDEDEDEFHDEYSSKPGQSMQRENPDDVPDPDSDSHDTGEENNDEGSGGGNPGSDPTQSEEEGSERKNDQSTENLEGKDEPGRKQSEDKPGNEIKGKSESGRPDDSPDMNPFGDEEQHSNKDTSGSGKQNSKPGTKSGEHSAGTGGGGDGRQSAWQHDGGGSSRRGDGEKDQTDKRQLDGDVDPESEAETGTDNQKRKEAQATEGTAGSDEDKTPSFMHDGEEQRKLEDKWKEISERMLVDLETSSKEWGDKSDAMLQGIKKINRDKYDYSTFLRKFSTLKEDIQVNDDEFDYVYYTLGLERYGNIPLIEPLEYKEVRKVRDFVIAIDTSGSCAGEVVQKFLDKTYSIFTQQENFFRKINLHIIQCDAQIQSDVKITDRQEFDEYMKTLEFKGFGGTDFRPVFEYVEQMIEHNEFDDLKGLIYFTDGNGTYPKKRPPYETAFIFVDDDEFDYEVPSWAMKLVLETSEITEEVLL